MRILHTADWHIGIDLNGCSLEADFDLFIHWLVNSCIPEHNPDVLLVSGDIFDKANPAAKARTQYYNTLGKLKNTSLKHIILTGGNHDHPLTLDAPAPLLKELDIHIIGGVTEDKNHMLIPLPNAQNPEVLIAAIPFLRDADIRRSKVGEGSEAREESVRQGITDFYLDIASRTQSWKQKGVPVLVAGHLFATGASTSDSERLIQVGNLGGVDATTFPEADFDYVALGHIHKPQDVGGSDRIRYSGSPIALSFSERLQQKRILLVETIGDTLKSQSIPIPTFRRLVRIEGDWKHIQKEVKQLPEQQPLPAWLELRIQETEFDPAMAGIISSWIEKISTERQDIRILQHRYEVTLQKNTEHTLLHQSKNLAELKPIEVLDALMIKRGVSEDKKESLRNTFIQLMELNDQPESL
jgi:exonuclease SbcD